MITKEQVGVVFGGPSPEHDISILTGLQAAHSMVEDGKEVCSLYWDKSGRWKRVPATLEASDFLVPEIKGSIPVSLSVPEGFTERYRRRLVPLNLRTVLNCCHGGPGEDGSLTAMLMMSGIRVTGPRPSAAALAMDKLATSALAQSVGVPSIETVLWSPTRIDTLRLPDPPWLVKPRWGGSSIDVEAGIEDMETIAALAKRGVCRAGLLVQPYLKDWIDLNVSVRSYPEVQCSAVERPVLGDAAILGYEEKYLVGREGLQSAHRELPADIPCEIHDRIVAYSVVLAKSMDLTGAPRFDFLWDGSESILMCEVNTIPGAWGNYLWHEVGVPRSELYETLVAEAAAGSGWLYQWSRSSDGRALRASDTIASKLI